MILIKYLLKYEVISVLYGSNNIQTVAKLAKLNY